MSPNDRTAVDPASATPLYHQIYLLFRQKMLNGELVRGDRLPSEEQVSEMFSVSRITSKRAMNELAAEGLVTRTRGRGTVVSDTIVQAPVSAELGGLMENLLAISSSTTVGVISLDYVKAPERIAQTMGVVAGTTVQRVERYRDYKGARFSHILSYIPAHIGRSFTQSDLTRKPILELIEAAGHVVTSAEQRVTATLADPYLADRLQTSIGAPLLKITRTVRDQDDVPIQHIEVHYLPEAYALTMNLKRKTDTVSGKNLWVSKES
ncbi:GntR family transcriptional regulator [Pseudaestuariivita sp.]|uniref:GntR family transcriptional regulator n=1 Tax=Pseudaestuariivita sp. TaxID=2211669 RepID=UPI00405804F8